MKKLVIYIHGKGGDIKEANHYKSLFKDCDIIGFDYSSNTPWEAKKEFPLFYDMHTIGYDLVFLIANSIGAYFSLCSLADKKINKVFLISPIVNMEKLIEDMMMWANISENELKEKKEITTSFGETLSWEYLCYVRENKLHWNISTHILYGEKDNLTSIETMTKFADSTSSSLTVMNDGEHWFHTPEQMKFLDEWIKEKKLKNKNKKDN